VPRKTADLGRRGEKLAADFLREQGYKILESNYRCKVGEIDIIARQGELIVFVEVKTSGTDRFGAPQSWVGPRKQRRLVSLASFYLQENRIAGCDVRFDVIGVEWKGDSPELTHVVDAFRPE